MFHPSEVELSETTRTILEDVERLVRARMTAPVDVERSENEALHWRLRLGRDHRFASALEPGITCLDPIKGQALFPFVHKKRLAWFLFDLFETDPLRFWRYQDDPEDVRRPIGVSEEEVVPAAVAGRSYGRMFGPSGGVDIRV